MDPIEITLPKKSPGVAELISAWEDGGVYPVTITQVSSDGANVVLSIAHDSEEADEAPMPKAPKKSSMKVNYDEAM